MRIIAGKARGHKLLSPKSLVTRPTLDRVKEAMFSAYTQNPDSPKLLISHLLDAIHETVPLSKTMKDRIDFLRKWSKTRAKHASAENDETCEDTSGLLLTPIEKESNRRFDL